MPTAAKYYYLETGGSWNTATNLAGVAWTALDTIGTVFPDSVKMSEGPSPDVMHIIIKSATNFDAPPSGRLHGLTASLDTLGRRPDGEDDYISLPCANQTSLQPFQLVRLREATSTAKSDAVTRFVGIITEADLDLTTETWRVAVTEIARFHMSKVVVRGAVFQDDTWVEDADCVFNPPYGPDELPSAPNMYYNETDQEVFVNHYTPNTDVCVPWKAGNVLNFLKKVYNGVLYERGQTRNYLSWDDADDLLSELMEDYSVLQNLDLTGLPLNEAIDRVITATGPYGWRCAWNESIHKYELQVYFTAIGNGGGTLQRGTAEDTAGPNVVGGHVKLSWSDCATRVVGIGDKKLLEVTLAYNPDGITALQQFQSALEPDWGAAEAQLYQAAEEANGSYDSYTAPFQTFKVKDDFDWDDAIGDGNVLPLGPLNLYGLLCTKGYDTNERLQAKCWRWDTKSSALVPQPEGVNVTILPGNKIHISGRPNETYEALPEDDADYKPEPIVIPTSVPARSYRYLTKWSAGQEGYPAPTWTVHPFVITLCVELPSCLVEQAHDTPENWPEMEDSIRGGGYLTENRKSALHLSYSGEPLESPVASSAQETFSDELEVIRSDSAKFNLLVSRRLALVSRPRLTGQIVMPVFDWTWQPGARVSKLVGGGATTDVLVHGVVASSNFTNISQGKQCQVLELEN